MLQFVSTQKAVQQCVYQVFLPNPPVLSPFFVVVKSNWFSFFLTWSGSANLVAKVTSQDSKEVPLDRCCIQFFQRQRMCLSYLWEFGDQWQILHCPPDTLFMHCYQYMWQIFFFQRQQYSCLIKKGWEETKCCFCITSQPRGKWFYSVPFGGQSKG